MFRKTILGLAAALSLTLPAAGAQAAEKVVTLSVRGVSIRAPLPETLCETTGAYADFATRAAALDTIHETLLTVMPCSEMTGKPPGMDSRFVVIKTPLAAETMSRQALVAAYRANPAAYGAAAEAGANSSKVQEMARKIDKDAKVSVGIKPVGVDDNGIYMAGVVTVAPDPALPPVSMVVAFSITEVGGKVLLWYAYGPGDTAGVLAEQVAIVKATTAAMVKAN